jgi:hypothetical protein
MSIFEEYKIIAKEKYIREQKRKEELQKIEEEQKRKEEDTKQLLVKIDKDLINFIKSDLDDSIKYIINANCVVDDIVRLKFNSIIKNIEMNYCVFEKYDIIDEIKENIICFINSINKNLEKKRIDIESIKFISQSIKKITLILKLDIDIEEMDTTDDEIYARQLQEEFYSE